MARAYLSAILAAAAIAGLAPASATAYVVGGNRWGVAPTVTFGLNGPTRAIISVYHMTSHEIPDTGIPFNNPITRRRKRIRSRRTTSEVPTRSGPTNRSVPLSRR